ncbi:MAG: hypothetical protein ACD_34C00031G0003 [uncultured bacterium]|nr:MAG: hypothetical protein ACD_34C00031G0003 [uncultured bacterium]
MAVDFGDLEIVHPHHADAIGIDDLFIKHIIDQLDLILADYVSSKQVLRMRQRDFRGE